MFSATFTFTPAAPTDDWATLELAELRVGDRRLERRTITALQTLAGQSTASIPVAAQTPAEIKALYRLFKNPRVTEGKILAAHYVQTRRRLADVPVALLTSDITEFDYTEKVVADDLGWIGTNTTRGFFFMPLFAVTPDRVPLGLVDSYRWLRTDISQDAQARKHAPIETKETFAWLREYRVACDCAAETPTTTLVYLADRGGDIYEIYDAYVTRQGHPRAEFLIRGCAYDRCLTTEAPPADDTPADAAPTRDHLTAFLRRQTPMGTVSFELPATAGHPARRVVQEVRAAAVPLQAPYRKGHHLADATIHAVLLTEAEPPPGQSPLEWLLYTSLPIETPEQVEQVVRYYLCRWEIELYFKVLKSGCQVEKLYLKTAERLFTCLALYMLVAWRVLLCARLGRACPDLPCTALLTDVEWKALYLIHHEAPLPTTPPALGTMLRLVARAGGFIGRAGDGEPGIQAMWLGLQRLTDYALAYERFGPERRSKARKQPTPEG